MATAVKKTATLSKPQTNGKVKKKYTVKERNKAIAEISASINRNMAKRFREVLFERFGEDIFSER